MSAKRTPVSRDEQPRSIPVISERLQIGRKRVESARVIVETTTRHDTVEVDEPLEADDVTIERVRVGRFVDAPVEPRVDGDVLIVPVLEEVVVVSRRLRIVEELRSRLGSAVREP